MKSSISYKNCLIRTESFQLVPGSSWVPQYGLTRQNRDNDVSASPRHHARLDKVFETESEADEFALQDAMQWIDNN
jgi:hypothetical protein